MANCIDNVLGLFPDADKKDLASLFDSMSKIRKESFMNASANPTKEFREKVQAMLTSYRRAVDIHEIKTLQNIAKTREVRAFMANPTFKNGAEALRAKLAGTFKAVKDGRFSVDYMMKGHDAELRELFIRELDQVDGLHDIFKSGLLDEKILIEAEQLAKKNGQPGKSGSSEALKIAEAIKKLNDARLVKMNDAGAFINKLDGYVMTRSYDAEALKKAGLDQFKKDIMEWVDFDRSFKKEFHTLDANEVIENIFNDIVNGKIDVPGATDADQITKIIGAPANMAKLLERGRTIHLKEGMEFQFLQKYGAKTLAEEINSSISKTSRSAALMSSFGTNPKATFEKLLLGLPKEEHARLMRYWKEIDGSTAIPGHSPAAKWGAGARKVIDMGSLGFSVLSSFPDLATRAGVMRAGGDNFLSAQLGSFKSFIGNLPKSQRREVMHLTGVNAEAMMGDIIDRFSSSDGGPGAFNKLHQRYFKAIGMRWWTEANMGGTAQMLSAGLGMRSGMGFSELDPGFAKIMNKYGIGPVEWDVLRQNVESVDGSHPMIGFSAIQDMPDAAVKQIMEAGGIETKGLDRVGKFKRSVSTKLATYFRDRSDISMNVAGARERAEVLRRGTTEDTAEGQAMRFFGQFKSYSVTMVSKFADMYKHEIIGEAEGLAAKTMSVAPLIVSMTALGYLAMVAKDMLKGKSPKDPFDRDTMLEAMARGGAGGIYGDYLLGEFDSRHGRSFLSAVAGPVLGKADDTMDLFSDLKEAGLHADPKKVKASALLRYAINIVPGNMPVVRQGLDWMVLNSMAESLNPGYNKRMKAAMEKYGQEPMFDEEGDF